MRLKVSITHQVRPSLAQTICFIIAFIFSTSQINSVMASNKSEMIIFLWNLVIKVAYCFLNSNYFAVLDFYSIIREVNKKIEGRSIIRTIDSLFIPSVKQRTMTIELRQSGRNISIRLGICIMKRIFTHN